MFDPESKVKYMLDGLANIILRPDMKGLLTEYQKMKIAKYEIPISSCSSVLEDELYSKRAKKDNGEEQKKLEMYMDETARKFDEAKASRIKNKMPKKKAKEFHPTRRKKIEAVRKEYDIVSFAFCRVNTDNVFSFKGRYYKISPENQVYAGKTLKDGDVIFDMDSILCAENKDGIIFFFDMNIEPVYDVECVGEQMKFF